MLVTVGSRASLIRSWQSRRAQAEALTSKEEARVISSGLSFIPYQLVLDSQDEEHLMRELRV
jgi:hypothetical protein